MVSNTCIYAPSNGLQKIRINGQLYNWVKISHYKHSGNFCIRHVTSTHSPNLKNGIKCVGLCVPRGALISFYASVSFGSLLYSVV